MSLTISNKYLLCICENEVNTETAPIRRFISDFETIF